MKCLVCRNLENCRDCVDYNNFQQKSKTDCTHEGIEIFNHKMKLPQYAEYKDSKKMRDCLLQDCIREAHFRNGVNMRTLCVQEGKL